jgi:hypothetical protein
LQIGIVPAQVAPIVSSALEQLGSDCFGSHGVHWPLTGHSKLQSDDTSETHCASHWREPPLWQQAGSELQTLVTQLLQPLPRASPTSHTSCAQVGEFDSQKEPQTSWTAATQLASHARGTQAPGLQAPNALMQVASQVPVVEQQLGLVPAAAAQVP